ncbi:GNAT family N-acetyltransferase [Lentzea guizhouensis]|uniref:GNAT family N-acetyltransferase n=1 Tax=Lentzea guizhouensis TaxID=1586287 RepID=A0A1B2HUK2_9PSEU|nr:GNAT family N-acetyltransferase [Lentzea guizhouensis]ANZ41383.1 GNAT family N-acetyltransferase [Lentzea guizhouensis]
MTNWPPTPIKTERLVLRESEAKDREVLVDLFSSPEVATYISDVPPRDEVDRTAPPVPGRRFGFFVVELDGAAIGMVSFDRRPPEHPGHTRTGGGEHELAYLFLPSSWGNGYASEACAAAMRWFAATLPGEPLVLTTQVANESSLRLALKLGFTEVERFEWYDAEQWFGVWSPVS